MLVLIFLLYFPPLFLNQHYLITAVCLLAALVIFLELEITKVNGILIGVQKIGDCSYSIYLIHLPLIYIFSKGFFSRIGIPQNYMLVSAIIFSVLAGTLLHLKVEKPLRSDRSLEYSLNFKTRGIISIGILAIMTSFLTFMAVGSDSHYWGLNKDIRLPTPAGYIGRNECALDTTFGQPCIFKAHNSKGLVYLIGDSHAAAISQTVKKVALDNGFSVAIGVHSGFPVAIASPGEGNEFSSALSYSNTQLSIDWITIHKPFLIIISENYAEWDYAEMERAILQVKSLTSNVLLVNQTPIFSDKPFMHFLSYFDKPYVPRKIMKLSTISRESIDGNRHFQDWGSSNGVRVLDPWSIFCNANFCSRYRQNHWLYYDLHHLTIYGADLLTPALTQSILATQGTN
jgi:SGNH domain (fused to AT3 domains)